MPATNPLHPTEVTDNDRAQRFVAVITHNPSAGYAFADPQMHAVVRQLSVSDRLIKVADMMTEGNPPGYKLQRFGTYNFDTPRVETKPEWLPVGNRVFSDPETAVRLAPQELAAHAAGITPHDPSEHPSADELNNPFA